MARRIAKCFGVAVDNKTNEITAIPEFLFMIDIENSIITLDAMVLFKQDATKVASMKAKKNGRA